MEKIELTAFTKSFKVPRAPGGTCLPGIPVTLIAGWFVLPGASDSTLMSKSSKKSRACTAVKASASGLLCTRCCLACGVVMIGRSRRRDCSTSRSKWSLETWMKWEDSVFHVKLENVYSLFSCLCNLWSSKGCRKKEWKYYSW